jgi:hypothetical protein
MVTKLKDNLDYVNYIRKRMKEVNPEFKEFGKTVCEGQVNNNFQIDFMGHIQGYLDSNYLVSFVKDRGLLELRIYHENIPVQLGLILYNGIIEKIPYQDKKWRLAICTELIEFYTDFLKSYFKEIN